MCRYNKKDGSDLVLFGSTLRTCSQLARTRQLSIISLRLGSLCVKNIGSVNKFLEMRVTIDDDGSYVLTMKTPSATS